MLKSLFLICFSVLIWEDFEGKFLWVLILILYSFVCTFALGCIVYNYFFYCFSTSI